MALAERATLITELRLDDKMSRGLASAGRGLDGFTKRAGLSSKNLQTLGVNLAKIGAVAVVGLGAAIKSGLSDLSKLNSAVTSVDGSIKQAGLTGQVTGSQVAAWANEIEANIGAAFDDKAIVQATSTLIRFGKVTPGNLRPAMQVITDLATKTGDVDSAATLLAKALADPEKAAGKLARSGVILTKQQQEQIKAFMKAGKAAEAQKVILDSLSKTTSGAALASQDEYTRGLSMLADASEDAKKALAIGFLPIITKVSAKLSKGLADPKTLESIREFGTTLAGAFDSLLSIAEKLPWGTIGDSMKIAGAGGKMLLDAFTKMPPWVQTAVITGWGLNKLTGGALSGIVGELGKGLIRGVLGMNAGVVNLKAGTVIGGGAVGGAGGAVAGGKGGGLLASVGKVFMVGMAVGVAAELASALADQSAQIREQGKGLVGSATANAPQMTAAELAGAIAAIDVQIDPHSWSGLALDITNGFNGGKDALLETRRVLSDKLADIAAIGTGYERTSSALLSQIDSSLARGYERTATGLGTLNRTVAGKNFSPTVIVGSPIVNVNTSISIRQLTRSIAVATSYRGPRVATAL